MAGEGKKGGATRDTAEKLMREVKEGRHPSEAEERWTRETLAKAVERSPEHPIGAATGVNVDEDGQARFTTISGTPVRRLYTQADLPEDFDERAEVGPDPYLGMPGEPPYTRGIHATGYRGKLWTMRRYVFGIGAGQMLLSAALLGAVAALAGRSTATARSSARACRPAASITSTSPAPRLCGC